MNIDEDFLKSIGITDEYFLISQTDDRGYITSCNKSFCKVSGYTESELIGKPHNVIRHKDMPNSAFESMWETIKRGDVWSGYVKNRRKNGRFYWVHSFVFPYKSDKGKIIYISYRRQASTKEIKDAMKQMGIKNEY